MFFMRKFNDEHIPKLIDEVIWSESSDGLRKISPFEYYTDTYQTSQFCRNICLSLQISSELLRNWKKFTGSEPN